MDRICRPPAAGRQAIFLGATEPRAARPERSAARSVVGQGGLAMSISGTMFAQGGARRFRACAYGSRLFGNRWLPQQKLRRSSSAVATSREGQRSRGSGPAVQHRAMIARAPRFSFLGSWPSADLSGYNEDRVRRDQLEGPSVAPWPAGAPSPFHLRPCAQFLGTWLLATDTVPRSC